MRKALLTFGGACIGLIIGGMIFVSWDATRSKNDNANAPAKNSNSILANLNIGRPATLSSTRYLEDMNEAHLNDAQIATLVTAVDNLDNYTLPVTETLGGLDCGAGTRHDQLVALNNGERKGYLANGGLFITETPNTYHWTTADLAAFSADESVVCGLGTTTPRLVIGNTILWWDGTLSGVGPPQRSDPDYQTTVKQYQAIEALDLHYGLED